MTSIKTIEIDKIEKGGRSLHPDKIIIEKPLTIYLNNNELATIMSTPVMLKELGIGLLLSEGLVKLQNEITKIDIDELDNILYIETNKVHEISEMKLLTSGCGKGIATNYLKKLHMEKKIETDIKVDHKKIIDLMKDFSGMSLTYQETGGVHSSALSDGEIIMVFAEDLGRHNAIDKIFGFSFLNNIVTTDKILLTSGRISSEIVIKALKRGVAIIISRNAPTSLSIEIAEMFNITIIGFVRGGRMNIYTYPHRVT